MLGKSAFLSRIVECRHFFSSDAGSLIMTATTVGVNSPSDSYRVSFLDNERSVEF